MRKLLAAVPLILLLIAGVLVAAAMAAHTPVTICHKPGTPAEHTITVDDDAVPAHLAHGDYLGPCQTQTQTTSTTTPETTSTVSTVTSTNPTSTSTVGVTTTTPAPPSVTTTTAPSETTSEGTTTTTPGATVTPPPPGSGSGGAKGLLKQPKLERAKGNLPYTGLEEKILLWAGLGLLSLGIISLTLSWGNREGR